MKSDPLDLDEAVAILERTPSVLRAWLAELPTPWIECTEGEETWSPFDIVGHLIHGERTDWIPRLRIHFLDEQARYEPFDRFAQFELSRGKTLVALLDEFEQLRRENVETLRGMALSGSARLRTAEHPELGEVTVDQLLSTWVAHDLGHLAQVARVMARRMADHVGPWRAYLPILQPR